VSGRREINRERERDEGEIGVRRFFVYS